MFERDSVHESACGNNALNYAHDARTSGVFHLGMAGGLGCSGRLPGIKSVALFDDRSEAAEQLDLNQAGKRAGIPALWHHKLDRNTTLEAKPNALL